MSTFFRFQRSGCTRQRETGFEAAEAVRAVHRGRIMRWTLAGARNYRRPTATGAFTLIELLTVVAIIGVLSAIVIPSASAVRTSAKRAKTKVMFSQWAAAVELFRQEYGFYPVIDDGNGRIDPAKFAGALTGRTLDGTAAASTEALGGNVRLIPFYTIGETDLSEARTALVDAFGNDDIAVLYDRNGDGRITAADGTGPAVRSRDTGLTFQPTTDDLGLSAGVRAGVIFYSAGKGGQSTDLIASWK